LSYETRYGIYLRPDPATCWAVTQITQALRAQFGIVSASAFPPHATLIGNLATDATVSEIIDALTPVFAATRTFTVYNKGVVVHGDGFEYDINLSADLDSVNTQLSGLAQEVKRAILSLSRPVDDFLVTPVVDYEFAGHLGLASHDLMVDNHLTEEVGDFIADLPIAVPSSFEARWFSLFEFRADWNSHWWKDMSWRHMMSWQSH